MFVCLVLGVAWASDPVAEPPTESDPACESVDRPRSDVSKVPTPDPTRRRVFITDPDEVAEIYATLHGATGVPGTRPARVSELQRWPVRDTVEGALLLVGATYDTVGDLRLGGGEPTVFIDGTQMSSSLR